MYSFLEYYLKNNDHKKYPSANVTDYNLDGDKCTVNFTYWKYDGESESTEKLTLNIWECFEYLTQIVEFAYR